MITLEENYSDEVWKDVKGYEGLYQISNLGKVKSFPKLHRTGSIGYTTKEKILKISLTFNGYEKVSLYKEGKKKDYRINRLVAIAFIPNPLNLPEVNHKDENKINNKMDNLEWCTKQYNLNYGTHRKRQAITRGNKVYQYSTNKEFIKVWDSTREAQRNGFDSGHISKCCNNTSKTHKGYVWSYTPLSKGDNVELRNII